MNQLENKSSARHSDYWDAVRGISLLIMVVIHTAPIVKWRPYVFPLIGYLYPLIEPIIFLSGFLISLRTYSSYVNKRPMSMGQTWKVMYLFLVRRVLRTWPLYYLFVIVCFLAPEIVQRPIKKSLLSFLTFTMNFDLPMSGLSHLWTLCIEEFCYLFFFLLIPFLRSKKIIYVFLIFALLSLLGRFFYIAEFGPLMTGHYFRFLWYPTFFHWDAFWYGCILGYFYPQIKPWIQNKRIWFLLSSVFILLLYVALAPKFGLIYRAIKQVTNPLWGTLISLGLVLGIEAIPVRWLRVTGLVIIGQMSYTLYLTHKVLIFNFVKWNRSLGILPEKTYIELGVCYLTMFLVGYILYWTLERPIINLVRRFH